MSERRRYLATDDTRAKLCGLGKDVLIDIIADMGACQGALGLALHHALVQADLRRYADLCDEAERLLKEAKAHLAAGTGARMAEYARLSRQSDALFDRGMAAHARAMRRMDERRREAAGA